MDLTALAAEFPRDAIHWRAQTLTRSGDKALALAYLDARDVMDRLDDVCGPAGWQDKYVETVKGRIICSIGIKVDDEWVWKSDGAGDTAVEGEKGGISDSFKRAAVHWGIGRYLYRLSSPWVQCHVKQKNGKTYWKEWAEDPWTKVKSTGYSEPKKPEPETLDQIETRDRIKAAIAKAGDEATLEGLWKHPKTVEAVGKLDEPKQAELRKAYNDRMAEVAK